MATVDIQFLIYIVVICAVGLVTLWLDKPDMEENKVAQMTKHTDTSRSTDSGVSGNAQTSAREIRKGIKMQYKRAPYSGVVGIGFFDQDNFIAVAIPPRETKEATEQLADIIEAALKAAEN